MTEITRLKYTQTLRNIFSETTAYFPVKICRNILHCPGDTTIFKTSQKNIFLRNYEV